LAYYCHRLPPNVAQCKEHSRDIQELFWLPRILLITVATKPENASKMPKQWQPKRC